MRGNRLVWVAVAACVVVALAWWAWRPRANQAETGLQSASPAPQPVAPPELPPVPDGQAAASDEEPEQGELAGTWENVDLEAIRRELPDNLYFEMAMPSDDPAVLEARDAERAHWNDEYGKVLSGNATEAEITAYYDYRHKLSADYVEFSDYVLDHHRAELPPRDVALLELAGRLHRARLAEIPRKLEEAFERKRQQDEARARWQQEEAEFAAPESD
jgi:hypothetical protein